jgi:Cof subfamily protein (haloacid dehalogenase superfamily)
VLIPYTLVVFDLDGTLVDDDLQIKKEDLRYIRKIRKLNVEITIATGRTFLSARPFIQKLGINYPVILCNGACVYAPLSDRILFQKSIMREIALFTLAKSNEYGLEPIVFIDPIDASPQVAMLTDTIKEYLRPEGFPSIEVVDLENQINKISPIKMQVVGDQEHLHRLKQQMLHTHPAAQAVMTQDNYIEIIPSGISKGEALRRLCESEGISLSQTVSFGDALNDSELLDLASIGIAMNHAPEALQDIADDTFSDIASALQEIFLIE